MNFPKNFLLGVATSAAQIEGAANADGRTQSIWDKYASISGNVRNNDTPAIACNSYNYLDKDIEALKFLGVNSYRFSISWNRILPDGYGRINEKGLSYYERLVDKLLKNGIVPNITLYHWDLPQILENKGGWLNRDTADYFAEYSSVVYKRLSDRVPLFATVNEPIATYVGYALGVLAPGLKGEQRGRDANHNLLLAHGKSVQAFRANASSSSKIGVVVDVWNREPFCPTLEDDVYMALIENEKAHLSYLNPIFKGKYSDVFLKRMDEEGVKINTSADDLKIISTPIDWFGLNCYGRIVVSSKSEINIVEKMKHAGGNFLSNGQEFYPKAVYDYVNMLNKDFNIGIPIYISENGYFSENEKAVDGIINDDYRSAYLQGFLDWTLKSIEEGNDIRGYYHWSLLDNYEWSAGYTYKFGLFQVLKDTLDRIPKSSAYYYANLIKKINASN